MASSHRALATIQLGATLLARDRPDEGVSTGYPSVDTVQVGTFDFGFRPYGGGVVLPRHVPDKPGSKLSHPIQQCRDVSDVRKLRVKPPGRLLRAIPTVLSVGAGVQFTRQMAQHTRQIPPPLHKYRRICRMAGVFCRAILDTCPTDRNCVAEWILNLEQPKYSSRTDG